MLSYELTRINTFSFDFHTFNIVTYVSTLLHSGRNKYCYGYFTSGMSKNSITADFDIYDQFNTGIDIRQTKMYIDYYR